ncbi:MULTISPECIES: hypothetical protein [Actinokineospora]|uniref:Uncharacterized protein n=1 Tax=Actinokineospora fastidiosa TaxID=1816 RepID=A0A918G6T5_9PSEU|nr:MULTISPECIES: hypothetical protein [Actinokineospora]UVS82295.1 hypothetical protein Actkin_06064 [Actinokineospora sp. UTMC 2448]GGS22236.1 hypothetical protein GCM10010171_13830 [Actinokineospora fastidiosa]
MAVTAALCGAFLGAGAVGVLLALSDREPDWMAVSAGVAALGALAAAFPVRTGHAWARVALFVCALWGVLTAHAVAVALSAPLDMVAGTVLALTWAAVIALLLRADVREFCTGPAAGHERLTG